MIGHCPRKICKTGLTGSASVMQKSSYLRDLYSRVLYTLKRMRVRCASHTFDVPTLHLGREIPAPPSWPIPDSGHDNLDVSVTVCYMPLVEVEATWDFNMHTFCLQAVDPDPNFEGTVR